MLHRENRDSFYSKQKKNHDSHFSPNRAALVHTITFFFQPIGLNEKKT